MGWEYLEVGYFPPATKYPGYIPLRPTATPRQLELRDWLDEVDIHSIGEYYINVSEYKWIHKDDVRPLESIEDAWEVVQFISETDQCDQFNLLMNEQIQKVSFTELTPKMICKIILLSYGVFFRSEE